MEHKLTEDVVITNVDEAQGVVDAVWAVMGNIDDGNDIIHNGAFTKTFHERGNQIKLLDNHRTDSVLNALGTISNLREVPAAELPPQVMATHPEATGGAAGTFQFLLDTPEGKGAFTRIQKGAVKGWSFGYDAVDKDFSTITKNGEDIAVRNLRSIKLHEISPVLFPMNTATATVSAKAQEAEDEGKADDQPGEYKFEVVVEAITKLMDALQAAGLLTNETNDEETTTGPPDPDPTPTSDDNEAGPPKEEDDTRLLDLINVELEELEV
jgi:phage head maturation protease